MDISELMTVLKGFDLGTITLSSVGGLVVGILTMRKMSAEAHKTDSEASKIDAEAAKIYADTVMAQFALLTSGYEKQIELMRLTVDRVNEEVLLLRAENRKLGISVEDLTTTNAELREDNENLRETNAELRENIQALRGEINRFLAGISSARNCTAFPSGCPAVKAIEVSTDPMLPGID